MTELIQSEVAVINMQREHLSTAASSILDRLGDWPFEGCASKLAP